MKQNTLTEGQNVWFENEKPAYKVMAVSKRYAVCTRKLSRIADADLIKHKVEMGAYCSFTEAYKSLKESPVYTILDFQKRIRASNNFVFDIYDYFDGKDCLKVIIDLMDGVCELSKRTACPLVIVD